MHWQLLIDDYNILSTLYLLKALSEKLKMFPGCNINYIVNINLILYI